MEKHVGLNPPGKSWTDEASSNVRGVSNGVKSPSVKPGVMKRRIEHDDEHTERNDDLFRKRSKTDAETDAKDTDTKVTDAQPTDNTITNIDLAPFAPETSSATLASSDYCIGWTDEQNVFVYDLSDEVLLNILKYLDSASLEHFGETCQRFQILSRDSFLFVDFDFRRRPLSASQLAKRLKYVHEKTLTFRVAGLRSLYPANRYKNITLTLPILEKLVAKCPKLREITVTDTMLDINCQITHFPRTLTSLTLKNCDAKTHSGLFFNRADGHMTQLTELRIENCNFFETNHLIALSKLPNLKVLSLRGCRTLRDCVPYGSVATRFGFQKLEHLDLRDTPISDSDIQCFNVVKTLRTIMLEYPKHHKAETERENLVAESAESSSTITAPSSSDAMPVATVRMNRHRPVSVANVIHVVVDVNGQNLHAQPEAQINGQNQHAQPEAQINGPPDIEEQQVIIVRNLGNHVNAALAALAVPGAPQLNRLGWEVVLNDNNYANGPYGVINYIDRQNRQTEPVISDRGICSFGMARHPHLVWIRAEHRMAETVLENVVVRGYTGVTDISLRHLAECAPNLRRIDITGTAVTAAGLIEFRRAKPTCVVLHSLKDVDQPDEPEATAD